MPLAVQKQGYPAQSSIKKILNQKDLRRQHKGDPSLVALYDQLVNFYKDPDVINRLVLVVKINLNIIRNLLDDDRCLAERSEETRTKLKTALKQIQTICASDDAKSWAGADKLKRIQDEYVQPILNKIDEIAKTEPESNACLIL